MRKENLKKIVKEIIKTDVPFSPSKIYKKRLKISYKTFIRGIAILMKSRMIYGYKISHGRGRGIDWIITSKDQNELVQAEKKLKA